MSENLQSLFLELTKKLVAFLPALFMGILLIGIGWLLGWFVKRLVVQLCVIVKLDRFLARFSWGKAFTKADVRYGLYRFIGNVFFFMILLIFFDFALIVWNLKFLSDLLAGGILLLPRTIAALLIFGAGWLIAVWTSRAFQKFLSREQIPDATAIAFFTKVVLIVLFSAIALFELNVAREIILIGFTTIFVTLGVLAVILTFIRGREWVGRNLPSPEDDT
ncbi:MAG TPA: hypothetical protein P5244_06925 [Syntrophales bacterium]|nr:hypothetical protein [Syntrophobacterales bacterium]HRR40949.1 hypothetical protein [Syntrophales bacterium]HRT71070.1 hypothetical protein [Syntrophales bacterium]